MSITIHYGKGANDSVDIGSVLTVFPAIAEVARVLNHDEEGYWELVSVPSFAEQDVTPWWLEQAAKQADKFLEEHGEECSENTRVSLEYISEQFAEALRKMSVRKAGVKPSPFSDRGKE